MSTPHGSGRAAPPASVAAWRDAGAPTRLDGDDIFVLDTGGGPDGILLLHGFPSSSFDWRGVVPKLAEHARVVAFDFLGHGLSDKPDRPYSLFSQADLAERVAEHAGLERCLLVSHDMGDSVAAELLARSTAGQLRLQIDGAVVTNGSIFIDMAELSAGQLLLLSMADERLADPLDLSTFVPGLTETFSEEHPASEEELEAMLWLLAHRGGDQILPRVIKYLDERRANQDRWTAGLVDFEGPLTALWGEQDPIAVVAMAHELERLRPSTDVTTWPDVAHWPAIEVPERVAAAILDRLP